MVTKYTFLRDVGTGQMGHYGNTLLDHLQGTKIWLEKLNADVEVQDAGLFHSIYGTERFQQKAVSMEERDKVRNFIGKRAERLAWLFCICVRQSIMDNVNRTNLYVIHRQTQERIPISFQEFIDLSNIAIANCLEQIGRAPKQYYSHARTYLVLDKQSPEGVTALKGRIY